VKTIEVKVISLANPFLNVLSIVAVAGTTENSQEEEKI
jgi:hypothetical protein